MTAKDNTEITTVQPPQKVTVGYERSIQVRPYETAKASIFVSADIVGNYNESGLFVPEDNAVNEAAKLAFFEAKVAVLGQLNLKYDVLENVVLENIDRILGPTEVVTSGAAPAAPKKTYAKGGSGASKDELYDDLLANADKWWDNRQGKKNPKAPDFKHKDSGDGIWLDKARDDVKAKYAAA